MGEERVHGSQFAVHSKMALTVRGDFIIIYLVIFAGVSFQINSLALILKRGPRCGRSGRGIATGANIELNFRYYTRRIHIMQVVFEEKRRKSEKN